MTQQHSIATRSRRRARTAAVALGLAVVGAGIGLSAGNASAHTPSVSASCTGGLSVSLKSYTPPLTNNTVTVTIDGFVQVFPFGASFAQTFPWDSTVSHVWTVAIDANLQLGTPTQKTQFDKTFGPFTVDACVETTPPTTAAPTTTTAPGDSTTTSSVQSEPPVVPESTTTTLVGAATTTVAPGSSVAVEPPVVRGSGRPVVTPRATLPATGTDTSTELTIALALLIGGIALTTATRRHRLRAGRDD